MFPEIRKIFSVIQNFFSKNAQNHYSKNASNVFLNSQNLSLIMRKMFPELHQIFPEIKKSFFDNTPNALKNQVKPQWK